MTIDIIGAGIGGLTMAIALEQKGIKTRIFEQADKLEPVGAGIVLANNAMQVYEKLGLRKVIEENGTVISSMNITTSNLKSMSKVDLSLFEEKHKVRNIAIHRGALQKILLNELKHTEIKLSHGLKRIERNDAGYLLNFKNGEQIKSAVLIAADGINSIARQNIFPNSTIRNARQICWRGVTDFNLPSQFKNELNEAWGRMNRFGFVQIAENKVYWYALKSYKGNKNELQIKNIEKYFSKYNPLVNEIIASTKKEQVNTSEMSDLKPIDTWYKENLCLIGDAAHAATPNLGQGACQAIVDAYVLSECLDKYERNQAFNEFQNLRQAQAHQIVKTSWMIGKIAHWANPILIKVRNLMIRLTPVSSSKKQLEQIFNIPKL